jgi:hypothetical protein
VRSAIDPANAQVPEQLPGCYRPCCWRKSVYLLTDLYFTADADQFSMMQTNDCVQNNNENRWAKSVARHYAAMEEQWSMPEEYADWPLKKQAASSGTTTSSASGATTESSSSSSSKDASEPKESNMPKDTKQVS